MSSSNTLKASAKPFTPGSSSPAPSASASASASGSTPTKKPLLRPTAKEFVPSSPSVPFSPAQRPFAAPQGMTMPLHPHPAHPHAHAHVSSLPHSHVAPHHPHPHLGGVPVVAVPYIGHQMPVPGSPNSLPAYTPVMPPYGSPPLHPHVHPHPHAHPHPHPHPVPLPGSGPMPVVPVPVSAPLVYPPYAPAVAGSADPIDFAPQRGKLVQANAYPQHVIMKAANGNETIADGEKEKEINKEETKEAEKEKVKESIKASESAAADVPASSVESSTAAAIHRYTKEFLLSLQPKPGAAVPPADLSVDGLDILRSAGDGEGDKWRPPRVQPTPGITIFPASSPTGPGPKRTNLARQNSGNTRGAPSPAAGKSSAANGKRRDQPMDIEIVPLSVSANRYIVARDIPPSEKLLRQLNAILNKLTPEKFDILVDQVLLLDISSVAALRDCVTAVFEKALAEPNFAPTYAEFCVKLSERLPSFPANSETDSIAQTEANAVDGNNMQSFKRLILNQCQAEFDSESTVPDESKPSDNPDEESAASKAKRRMLGAIRFIGELFVRGMLAAKIMRFCIVKLLGDISAPVEEDCESLCKLLGTVGEKLDNPTASEINRNFIKETFANLEKLAADKANLSSRIRFMIQDTIELRQRSWVARRKADVAKKISEIHAENAKLQVTIKEPAKPAASNYAPGSAANRLANTQNKISLGLGRPNQADRYAKLNAAGQNADEWNTVPVTSGKAKFSRPAAAAPAVGREAKEAANGESEQKRQGNSFDLLKGEEAEDSGAAAPQEADSADGQAASSSVAAAEFLPSVRSLYREYFTCEDVNEAILRMRELGSLSSEQLVQLPCEGILLSFEQKEKQRQLLAKLFTAASQQGVIQTPDLERAFVKAIGACVEEDGISIDFPLCQEQTLSVLAQCMVDESMQWNNFFQGSNGSFFSSLAHPLTASDQQKFVVQLLTALRKLLNTDAQLAQWLKQKQANMDAILNKDEISKEAWRKLINEKKLEAIAELV